MSDLIERLRATKHLSSFHVEAAAEIEKLRRERDEARKALKPFADGAVDVSGAAVIVGHLDAKRALVEARRALSDARKGGENG